VPAGVVKDGDIRGERSNNGRSRGEAGRRSAHERF
jgi:hypothetical protein